MFLSNYLVYVFYSVVVAKLLVNHILSWHIMAHSIATIDSHLRLFYIQIMKTIAKKKTSQKPLVAIIMGSKSDWETMQCASQMLKEFGVPHECKVVSAHRTPSLMKSFAEDAQNRGLEVIIAGAGGAAHLPGMTASHTILPVLGVPVETKALNGLDSLLSIAQMPGGVPVGTLAIGKAGAKNAGLLAVAILALSRPSLKKKLLQFRSSQTKRVMRDKVR
jgi:5-(carboxyamino)imidazole ribonucleotide mutase